MKALVSKGEELGYGYLAVGDHIVVPKSVESTYPYSDGGDWPAGRSGEVLEPLSMLAYLAGQTSTARLLTSVIVVPPPPPGHHGQDAVDDRYAVRWAADRGLRRWLVRGGIRSRRRSALCRTRQGDR